MHSSDSGSNSGWNKELITAVSKKQGKSRIISEQDRIKQIKDCLDEGADINTIDENGNTALHMAVKKGYQIIVEFLKETGARTNIPNRKGETAISLAEKLGKQEIASILNDPYISQKIKLSDTVSTLNYSSRRPNRKRTTDAGDGSFDAHLNKIKLIDDSQADSQRDIASVEQRLNQKRTADDELGKHAKRLRKLTFTDVPKPDICHDVVEEEPYDASGLKRSLHGTVYQLKHLMLILHRAWKMGYSFRLATEMDAAEKFHDVVVRYRDSNGDEVYRFVQAKHKQDESKVIGANDLLDVKAGDFSLFKYFLSWRKIKKHPDFGGNRSKNFILCTNIGLDIDSLKEKNINVRKIMEPDDFLKVTNRIEQPPRYKLLVKNPSGLWDTLKSASDVYRLAKELAVRVCGSQDIHLNTDIIKSYHVALAEEVVNVREKKFSVNFINNNCLSRKAAEFREIFLLSAKRLLSKRNSSEKYIWKLLAERSLKLSSNFGKKTQLVSKPEQSQFTKLPEDLISDAEISSFFDEFTLAVNQPNEELGEIIQREIGVHGQLNLPDARFVRDSIEIEIFNWFRTKQGKFLQNKDAGNFFDEMKAKLGSLKAMALSSEYSEKFNEFGIQFNCEIPELQNFINCPNHTPNQVLEIISSKQTLLTAVQVHQTLSQSTKSPQNEGFIFVRLKTLSRPETMKLVLLAFKWPRIHNLLVIDCESIVTKRHLQSLWNPLCDIIAKDVDKRMIVITQAGKDLGTECNLSRQICRVKYTDHSFDNFTRDSQKKLLRQRVRKFQGHNNETNFGELLGIHDCDNLNEDELKDLSDMMDSDTLVKLISEDEIRIGCELDGFNEIEDYYVNRTIFRHLVIRKYIVKNTQVSDLMAVDGISRILPGGLVRMTETSLITRNPVIDLCAINSNIGRDIPNKIIRIEGTSMTQYPTNLIMLDSHRDEEPFNAVCARNEDCNVHWLQWGQGKYIWKKSRGNITHLVRHRDASENDDNNDRTGATYLRDDQLADHDKPVIISGTAGTGKSAMLDYLAWEIKENKPDMLVLKIDLSHHSTALVEIKKKSSYDLGSINEVIKFLVKEIFNYETNLARKVFKRIIERKHKVALIFDGFDEISPTYEGTVIDLLQTLADYGIKKLIVATRPHTKRSLEAKLNAFSYEIQPFSTYDQERFLANFWIAKFQDSHYDLKETTKDRIRKYTMAIMEKLANPIKDQRNNFIGIPLQAKLVSEIFESPGEETREDFDSCKEFINSEIDKPKFPEKINPIYLYEHFVDKKFYILFKKRGGNLADVAVLEDRRWHYKMFMDIHTRLALDTLFGKEKIRELLLSQQDENDRSLEPGDFNIPVEQDGIITQFIDGQPRFGHRTYAEYFAAKFFSKMLKKREHNESLGEIFVADILLRENFKIVRAFMDCLLSDIDVNVLDSEFWTFYLKTHRSQRKETVFHVAAAEGNDHIIKLFINCLGSNPEDRKVLIHVKDTFGRTAVHRAVEYGHLENIKLLIEDTDFEIDSRNDFGFTPLYQAVWKGRLDIVKYFINKGANIKYQDDSGFTPLHAATHRGKSDVAKYLLEKGADINSQTNDGWTPLHVPAKDGKLDIVKFLLDKGAAYEGKLSVVKHLVDNRADINSQTKDGWMPLHVAAYRGKLDIVKYLLVKEADIRSQTNDSFTPLHVATYGGKLNVAEYLIGRRVDINIKTNKGSTPMRLAAEQGELNVVKYLIGKGANIDSYDNDGSTPMHLATQGSKLDVVKYLLDIGGHVSV